MRYNFARLAELMLLDRKFSDIAHRALKIELAESGQFDILV